ncbi:unnamed protein product [Sphacelaria rigidula]
MYGEVLPQIAHQLTKEGYSYIDVRDGQEFEQGHPAGSVNIPAFFATAAGMQQNPDFVKQVAEKYPEKDTKLLMGCQMGSRSAKASAWLEEAGYEAIINVEGGYSAWARDDNLPVEV